jgi:peptide/nickel transport system permease protein
MRIPSRYLVSRLLNLIAVVWFAATINFLLPRITAHDPVLEYLLEMSSQSGERGDRIESMLAFYRDWAGLNQPLWRQYLTYLSNIVRLDFGRSFRFFWPVTDVIMRSLPYTVVLLSIATILAFLVGTGVGAWAGWKRDATLFKALVPVFISLSSIPPFIIALVALYVFSFRLRLFPFRGSYSATIAVDWTNIDFLLNVVHHAALPVLTMILVTGGTWALWMRGMIVTVVGEDYMIFAEAKGLKSLRRFYHYAIRNVMLPQVTQLAISLGTLVSGYALVETMFSYPGVGHLLAEAILANDYAMIQGIVFFLILAIALATFLLDMTYPLLDPRIRYEKV